MKRKLIYFLLVIIVFILTSCIENSIEENNEGSEADYSIECITKVIKTVKSTSMQPMIIPGDELMLLEGYYNCNNIERGDVVAYSTASVEYPIIKKIAVIGGDSLEFKDNNLLVNNEILKNSIGEEYKFKANEIKMISLYIEEGKLKEDIYLIFGDNIYNSKDSKNFGAISKNGIIGKFIVNK